MVQHNEKAIKIQSIKTIKKTKNLKPKTHATAPHVVIF